MIATADIISATDMFRESSELIKSPRRDLVSMGVTLFDRLGEEYPQYREAHVSYMATLGSARLRDVRRALFHMKTLCRVSFVSLFCSCLLVSSVF